MTVVKGFPELAKLMRLRASRMKNVKERTNYGKAVLMKKYAIAMAPEKTGETKRGITAFKSANGGWSVISQVPGSFKQNLWANQTGKYLAVKMWWADYQPVVYGSGVTTITGKSVNWTGMPGFFDRARVLVRSEGITIARKEMKLMLSGTVV